MKEDHISCLLKMQEIVKYLEHQSNTPKLKWVLFFTVDYEFCFFGLSPPFSSLLLFSAFRTYAYVDLHILSNFRPFWLFISCKSRHFGFNRLLIPGD